MVPLALREFVAKNLPERVHSPLRPLLPRIGTRIGSSKTLPAGRRPLEPSGQPVFVLNRLRKVPAGRVRQDFCQEERSFPKAGRRGPFLNIARGKTITFSDDGSLKPQRRSIARAFCSTANLGPGFDTFGIALDNYYDEVRVSLQESRRVRIRVVGRYATGIPTYVDRNSAGPPALEMLSRAEVQLGLEIVVEKNVPVGQGLGSSGATAAACVKALDSLLQLGTSPEELVQIASLGEAVVTGAPHADNVAASLLGGFIIVYGKNPINLVSIKPPKNLAIVVVSPKVRLPRKKTMMARSLIPSTVNIEDAVQNIGRASAIAVGFAKGDLDMITNAMEDRIAEPYRQSIIPGYRDVKEAALASHAIGIAISGAGPSLVALVDRSRQRPIQIGWSMVRAFAKNNVTATFFVSRPAPGASLI